LRCSDCRLEAAPKLPRNTVFVQPRLVAEVEFREWTSEGIMRAPSFKGLREDKAPAQVVREAGAAAAEPATVPDPPPPRDPGSPEALFESVERLPDGALAVVVDGRRLKLTNWDKVLFPQAGFTKGDLIAYYTRAADVV